MPLVQVQQREAAGQGRKQPAVQAQLGRSLGRERVHEREAGRKRPQHFVRQQHVDWKIRNALLQKETQEFRV
jgi:hypothetical protein